MKEDNTYYDEMDGLNLPGSLRVNPFVVPENYFGQLSSTILSQTHIDRVSNSEKIGFIVPESYFSQLTDNIQLQVKMEQYKDFVHRGERDVPKGYFEDLSDRILSQTRIEAVERQDVFDVPMGYFDSLSLHIQTKIFEETLKERMPADGFTIPKDYTGILKDKIVAQTTGKERQESKTIVRRLNFNKWMQYAAAACVTLVIGIATYNSININAGSSESFSESHLSSIPEDEIITYLSALNDSHDIMYIMECINHPHDADGVCTHVKENDIEDYLNYAL